MASPKAGKTPAPPKKTAKPAAPVKVRAGSVASKRAKPAAKKSPSKAKVDNAVAIKAAVCAQLASGVPLTSICSAPGMPSRQTVYGWAEVDSEFALHIARAREDGHDAIAEESLAIVDQSPERDAMGKIDSGWVALQKLRAEHRLKLLAKWSKKYAEKSTTEVTGANGGAIVIDSRITLVSAPARPVDEDEA